MTKQAVLANKQKKMQEKMRKEGTPLPCGCPGSQSEKHPAHGDPAGGDRLRRTGQPAVPVAGADQAGPGAGAVF